MSVRPTEGWAARLACGWGWGVELGEAAGCGGVALACALGEPGDGFAGVSGVVQEGDGESEAGAVAVFAGTLVPGDGVVDVSGGAHEGARGPQAFWLAGFVGGGEQAQGGGEQAAFAGGLGEVGQVRAVGVLDQGVPEFGGGVVELAGGASVFFEEVRQPVVGLGVGGGAAAGPDAGMTAWIAAGSAVVGALAGGAVTGWFTLAATRKQGARNVRCRSPSGGRRLDCRPAPGGRRMEAGRRQADAAWEAGRLQAPRSTSPARSSPPSVRYAGPPTPRSSPPPTPPTDTAWNGSRPWAPRKRPVAVIATRRARLAVTEALTLVRLQGPDPGLLAAETLERSLDANAPQDDYQPRTLPSWTPLAPPHQRLTHLGAPLS